MRFIQTLRTRISNHDVLLNTSVVISIFAVLCGAILLGNLNEDSFIVFRSIENFVNGYGLQYSIDERSQSYTDPAWVILHIFFRLIFSDIRIISICLSLTCTALMLLTIFSYFKKEKLLVALLIFLPLSFSHSFLEYSTSGLENSLSHLLGALFFCIFLKEESLKNIDNRKIFLLATIACFAVLNRFDTVIYYIAPLLCIALISKNNFFKTSALIFSGFVPLLIWLIFATLYYGYPLPDTYYAKLIAGTPSKIMIFFGLNYYYRFIETNLSAAFLIIISLTLSTFFIARKIFCLKSNFLKDESAIKILTVAISLLLYCYYCLTIGDYMLGRFFTTTLLISLILLTYNVLQNNLSTQRNIVSALFLIAVFLTIFNTFNRNFIYKCDSSITHINCSKESLYKWKSWVHTYRFFDPSWHLIKTDHLSNEWHDLGSMANVISRLESTKRPLHITHYSAGVMPFYAGPFYWITDQLGYTDPFLARLPAGAHKPGHFIRNIPNGYIEWRFSKNQNLIDPNLKYYYDGLREIKTMPLFESERIKKIIRFNLGFYDDYLKKYVRESHQLEPEGEYSYSCDYLIKNKRNAFDSPFHGFICDDRK